MHTYKNALPSVPRIQTIAIQTRERHLSSLAMPEQMMAIGGYEESSESMFRGQLSLYSGAMHFAILLIVVGQEKSVEVCATRAYRFVLRVRKTGRRRKKAFCHTAKHRFML